jgi:ATP-dependent Clp protease ATP-binding subunit ClpC
LMDFLSPEGARVLEIAQKEAGGLHHEFTGTEHLLLGLLACDDSIAAPLLAKHGIVAVEVRAQVARAGSRADSGDNGQPLTARAKQVLSLASREAEELDDDEVAPEHLLLGIIRQASGVAALVLRDMGVDLTELREEVLEAREGRERSPGEAALRLAADEEPADEPGIAAAAATPSERNGRSASARETVPALCPGCGRRLADVLTTASVSPDGPSSGRRRGAGNVTLIYCGACGHTLAAR